MTRGGGFRPAGQVASFAGIMFSNNAGQIAITYTTNGFLAGFSVGYWYFDPTGLPILIARNPTGSATNVNIGRAAGLPSTVWATIQDDKGELCAKSPPTIL